MCGRYNIRTNSADFAQLFGTDPAFEPPTRYNAAPTQMLPIVRMNGERHVSLARWGLIPSWAKDHKIGYRLINARSETVDEKPSFRLAFKSRRCLVPASGFYEWKKLDARTKQAHHIHRKDDGLFAFAGLWERWTKGDEPVESFTILTTLPNATLSELHDRMPVILPDDSHAVWLDPDIEPQALKELLRACGDDLLDAYPCNRIVGNAQNEVPECIEPVAGDL